MTNKPIKLTQTLPIWCRSTDQFDARLLRVENNDDIYQICVTAQGPNTHFILIIAVAAGFDVVEIIAKAKTYSGLVHQLARRAEFEGL